MQFLELRERFASKSFKEITDFLRSEDSANAGLMRRQEAHIEQTLREVDFEVLKALPTKARRLADAIAGKELFDWSFTYSVQRAGEFRRARGQEPEE